MLTKTKYLYQRMAMGLAVVFFLQTLCPSFVFAQSVSAPLTAIQTPALPMVNPPIMAGVQLDAKNPFLFKFFIDPGDDHLEGPALDAQTQKMVKYFLASLAIPRKNLWVNLSPHEQQRVIDEQFGQTDMGLDLLAQDYLLKQVTASLVNPESDLGKAFWKKVYQKSYELYGTTNIDVDTFNKVWIVPDKAVVFQKGSSAFIVESSLKVMLEQDYLAMDKQGGQETSGTRKEVRDISSVIMREIIIPELEQRVNTGKDFALLRQIYHALILADWFKNYAPQNLMNKIYLGENKVAGIDSYVPQDVKNVYENYVQAYQAGVQQKVIAQYDEQLKKYVPRKYFSGGVILDPHTKVLTDPKAISSDILSNLNRPMAEYTVLQKPVTATSGKKISSILPTQKVLDSEYDFQDFIKTIPAENREQHMEVLKDWIIRNAPRHFKNVKQWGNFLSTYLPLAQFSRKQEQEIIKELKLEAKITEELIPFDRAMVIDRARDIPYSYGFAIEIAAKDVIAYLRLHSRDKVPEHNVSEVLQEKRVITDRVLDAIGRTRESYAQYFSFRQIIKDAFFVSKSKAEEIDRLMRIVEQEVNVSTHKGQDLLSPSDLRRLLSDQPYQRRKSGPNNTYDPEVTKALEQLLKIVTSLANKSLSVSDDLVEMARSCCSDKLVQELERAQGLLNQGRKLQALLALTHVRRSLYEECLAAMKEAERLNFSQVERWGDHVYAAKAQAQKAYQLMETDILLEQKIVDAAPDVFKAIRPSSLAVTPEKTQQMLEAIYIIVKNLTTSLPTDRSLDHFAEQLLKLRSQETHSPYDLYVIYGIISQIEIEFKLITDRLTSEYKWRVELIQQKEGVPDPKDTPASLGFAQDFLRTTMLGQFNERFLLDCKKAIDEIEGPQQLALRINRSYQYRAREIINIPLDFELLPRVIGYDEATEAQMKRIGSKVHGLYLMKKLGLPVLDFFVIRSSQNEDPFKIAPIRETLEKEIAILEKKTGKKFGDPENPLLISLRSTFPVSMPGLFSTALNVGMNEEVFEGLKKEYGERFALRSYILFLHQYGILFQGGKDGGGLTDFDKLVFYRESDSLEDMRQTIARIKKDIFEPNHIPLPQDPMEQLEIIVDRIMNHGRKNEMFSFFSVHGIPEEWKPSVIAQEMDFGYLDKDSYTAVVHTRNIHTGENTMSVGAAHGAGVDLVGQVRPDIKVFNRLPTRDQEILEGAKKKMERVLQGPVEFEITKGKALHFLQARVANLDVRAMPRVLWSLIKEGILSEEETAPRIEAFRRIMEQDDMLVDKNAEPLVVAAGLAGGITAGPIALSLEKAKEYMEQGKNACLIMENTPDREDKSYFRLNDRVKLAVATAHGGDTQHFAVWARLPNIRMPYISMIDDLKIDLEQGTVTLGGKLFHEGDVITMDAYRGLIFEGDLVVKKTSESEPSNIEGDKGVDSVSRQISSNAIVADGKDGVGGIDLTESFRALNIKIDQNGSPLAVEFQDMEKINLDGLVPVILNVTPVVDLPALLGLGQGEFSAQEAVL